MKSAGDGATYNHVIVPGISDDLRLSRSVFSHSGPGAVERTILRFFTAGIA